MAIAGARGGGAQKDLDFCTNYITKYATQNAGNLILALLFSSCVTLGKSLNFPESQFFFHL